MNRSTLARRAFLRNTAAGASALALGSAAKARAAARSDEVVLGFIGCGGRGSTLLQKIVRTEGVRVAAVCDLRTERVAAAQETAKRFSPKGYTNFEEMLDKEKLDGVIVATEVGNHAKTAIPVLERNIHCFCEKPLETTVERMDALVRAARKSKAICQIGFQRHYNDGYVKAIEKIHSGDLGKISFLQGQWSWVWEIGGGWVADMDLGGGELVEQAGHHMDVMAWVMKYQHPIDCVAMANISREIPADAKPTSEDHSGLLFRFPGNVIFSYTHLFYCPQPFQLERMLVYGQTWGIDLVKGELYLKGNKTEKLGEDSGTDWGKGTNEELDAFVENIRSGGKEKPRSNIETARIATLMCFMGRAAFRDVKSNKFEPRLVKWEDLGSTTEP
ncbi:MAG: Gfo/Idh/MocA family oxidoreductase [Candidatus Sumerlaeia bacterium]|nr:Gfo/Idh/MocA family oxidoreductase [Candidatus Sumerlaeia bacterium]